jgi:hypothetical protein
MEYTVRQEAAFLKADATAEKGRIEIGDDEFVLDSEYRGAHRVVVAVATPVETGTADQCQWITENEEQCGRDAEAGRNYCWQHPNES